MMVIQYSNKKALNILGQPLFAVAATTTELARKAVLKGKN